MGNGPATKQHDERGENAPDRQSDQIAASSSLIRSFRFLSSWIITSFGAGRFNSALILASIPACLDWRATTCDASMRVSCLSGYTPRATRTFRGRAANCHQTTRYLSCKAIPEDSEVQCLGNRSEESRVGKGCVSTWRSRGWPEH